MAKKEGSCFRNARDASVVERRGILGGIGARRTRMRRWAGLAAAPPLDSRLTFAILPPILRLAPLRPETRQAACCTLLARPSVRRSTAEFTIASPFSPIFHSLRMKRIDRFFEIRGREKRRSKEISILEKGIGRRGGGTESFGAFICLFRRCRII